MLLHEEGKFDQAEKMFERASRFTGVLHSWLVASHGGMDVNESDQIISQIFDNQVTNASNAWHRGKLDKCHNLLGGVFIVHCS